MVAKTLNPSASTTPRTAPRPASRLKPEPITIRLGADKPPLVQLFADAMRKTITAGMALQTRDWKPGRHKIAMVCVIDKPETAGKRGVKAAARTGG